MVQASLAGVLSVLCLAGLSGPTVAYAADPFTVVALPDTQFYARDNPWIFDAQSQWIVDHAAAKNIRFVTHLGDIVDNGYDLTQWANAKASMSLLDAAQTPYGTAMGNHDNGQYKSTPNYDLLLYDSFAVNYQNNGAALWQMAYANGRRDPSFTLSVDFASYVVPEPSTLSLLVVGMLLLGMAACRRRR